MNERDFVSLSFLPVPNLTRDDSDPILQTCMTRASAGDHTVLMVLPKANVDADSREIGLLRSLAYAGKTVVWLLGPTTTLATLRNLGLRETIPTLISTRDGTIEFANEEWRELMRQNQTTFPFLFEPPSTAQLIASPKGSRAVCFACRRTTAGDAAEYFLPFSLAPTWPNLARTAALIQSQNFKAAPSGPVAMLEFPALVTCILLALCVFAGALRYTQRWEIRKLAEVNHPYHEISMIKYGERDIAVSEVVLGDGLNIKPDATVTEWGTYLDLMQSWRVLPQIKLAVTQLQAAAQDSVVAQLYLQRHSQWLRARAAESAYFGEAENARYFAQSFINFADKDPVASDAINSSTDLNAMRRIAHLYSKDNFTISDTPTLRAWVQCLPRGPGFKERCMSLLGKAPRAAHISLQDEQMYYDVLAQSSAADFVDKQWLGFVDSSPKNALQDDAHFNFLTLNLAKALTPVDESGKLDDAQVARFVQLCEQFEAMYPGSPLGDDAAYYRLRVGLKAHHPRVAVAAARTLISNYRHSDRGTRTWLELTRSARWQMPEEPAEPMLGLYRSILTQEAKPISALRDKAPPEIAEALDVLVQALQQSKMNTPRTTEDLGYLLLARIRWEWS